MSSLPSLYATWVEQCLGHSAPSEARADCTACPMCSTDSARNPSGQHFNPRTKCCTFMPDLPNFLVGRIYRESSRGVGWEAFQAQLRRGLIVTPLGMSPSASYWELYRAQAADFGRSEELRCPYLLEQSGGSCGIHDHRNARCACWFCRFERGTFGVLFWKHVDQMLSTAERALARWCILELDPGAAALQALFPPLPSVMDFNDLPLMWGAWAGREREFYERCAMHAEGLSWKDLQAIGGAELAVCERLVLDARRWLATDGMPLHLRKGEWKRTEEVGEGSLLVWAYNRYDPLEVPAALAAALPRFDGRESDAVRSELAAEGIELPADLLRRLVDWAVLVPG